jgi:SAM-dependent methyltransferase
VTGPGPITSDGCAVEVYRQLPAMGEPELVHAVAGPGARILDLGAGTGRIADPLVDLGHDVVAVDDSAQMLARVRRARTHLGRIEDLDLGERFDVVLLASYLLNTPDDALRGALLLAARRHLVDDGRALFQWHEPAWFDGLAAGTRTEGRLAGLTSRLEVDANEGGLLTATVSYDDGARSWRQPFTARRLDLRQVAAELAAAGLAHEPDAPAPSWLLATADRPLRGSRSASPRTRPGSRAGRPSAAG